MLKPVIIINPVADAKTQYKIYPESFESEENERGIEATVTTKHNKYDIRVGDRYIFQHYYKDKAYEYSYVLYPVMVVSAIEINDEYQLILTFVDEFQYECKRVAFFPQYDPGDFVFSVVNNKTIVSVNGQGDGVKNKIRDELQWLADNLKYKFDSEDPYVNKTEVTDITIESMLGYLQSRMQDYIQKTLFESFLGYTGTKLIENKLFFIGDNKLYTKISLNTNIGGWIIYPSVKVNEIINKLRENYFYEIKMSCDRSGNLLSQLVTVSDIGRIKLDQNKEYLFVDNVNIINDSFSFENIPPYAIQYIFKDKPKDSKDVEKIEILYYYNGSISNKNPGDEYFVEKYEFNNANKITPEQRQLIVKSKYKKIAEATYTGTFDTFGCGITYFDRISLVFNNSERYRNEEGEVIGTYENPLKCDVKKIKRIMDQDGLHTSIDIKATINIT